MRIAGTIHNSVVNGVGIRDVIFVQGCIHRCKGCHNPETWNLNGGTEMTVEELVKEFKDSTNHVTISGGEPFFDTHGLVNIILELQAGHPEKRFWIYTGYRYEELEKINPILLKALSKFGVDVIVDGRFEEDKKDLTLQFRGSSNQRIIDLPKTIANGKITLWEETNGES